ncbi:MAG: hypothetical protein HY209_01030 [Candidatus Omnitrophica bacterium]|nr:hypothetical protein [Candidatus Omnitrophota bacterium]
MYQGFDVWQFELFGLMKIVLGQPFSMNSVVVFLWCDGVCLIQVLFFVVWFAWMSR